MVQFPPFLRAGDRVVLVAPSSPFDAGELRVATRRLDDEGFAVAIAHDAFDRDDYLAGSDARRRGELQRALDDASVRAVIAVRGGYGAGRIVAGLDATAFRAQPKWIVGFSDITVLHAFSQAHGVASIHGPNASGMGRSDDEAAQVLALLRGERREERWAVRALAPFDPVEGLAAGGNLTVLAHEAIAGRLPSWDGRVVFLEDVGEKIYRVDRMLAALVDGRFFSGVRAIVFGHFTRCEGNAAGRDLTRLVDELRERLQVPVVLGAPFGHEAPNACFVQGAHVTVSASAVVQRLRTA